MPPRVKITKEEIINTAVDIVRKEGAQAINARNIAAVLNCSTQPIFSNFTTMDDLRYAIIEKIDMLCQEYMKREVESGAYPDYKASGMAYIRFAKEERELFKLLYMRDRADETFAANLKLTDDMHSLVKKHTGLEGANVELFHLEMWACVHGIATMFATGFVDLEWELVSKMITDTYQGLKKQYGME